MMIEKIGHGDYDNKVYEGVLKLHRMYKKLLISLWIYKTPQKNIQLKKNAKKNRRVFTTRAINCD